MLELIIITIIAGLAIASAYDLKGKYVPDYVSYSLVIIGISLRIFYSIAEAEPMIIIWSLIAGSLLFGFGYVLYKTGAWGGGDVKIIAVCGIYLAWFPTDIAPFFINFTINLMIIGALYGIPAAIITAIKKRPKLKFNKYEKITIPSAIIAATIMIILTKTLFSVLMGFCLVMLASIRIFKLIEEKCFIKNAKPKELMEGDWLLEPIKLGKKTIKPRKEGLTKEEVKQIMEYYKKGKLKSVWIKDGIAYVPAFLITTILTIFFDNILMKIMITGFY